ncbi:MAG: bacteriophage abortive infection AbiH family protein [Hyphomonadaceae bacterium]
MLTDDASEFLVSYAADDWSDDYHHAYQFEINQAVEAISVTLRSQFANWIRQLPIPAPSMIAGMRLPLDSSAIFLNFNYTPSLQRLYCVPDANILHIHGAVGDPDARLVLGHGWKPENNPDPYRFTDDPESADTRVVEGQQIIDRYFRDTFKPTQQIISDHRAFFAGLSNVDNIFVMGHHVSEVDHPYFREVIRNIDASRARWKFSYFGDLALHRERVEKLGIAPHLVEYALLADF